MYSNVLAKATWRLRLLAGFALLYGSHGAADLTLSAAEALATQNDPALVSIRALSESANDMAEAAKSLPDPQIRLGLANLPTDSFRTGQEAMTQTVVGIRQAFPRGNSRQVNSRIALETAARGDAAARDRSARVTRQVRETFIRIVLQKQRQRVLHESTASLSSLADIVQSYYANGRAGQQDVVQAELEVSRFQERVAASLQSEQVFRAELAEWIGDPAWETLDSEWPRLAEPLPEAGLNAALGHHPRLEMQDHAVRRARISEDLARQAYKPGFAVDLAYGSRTGFNPDGSSRSDLFSLTVSMDWPLFSRNQQDRTVAARISETSAQQYEYADALRHLQSEAKAEYRAFQNQLERLRQYHDQLLPMARWHVESATQAYQAATGDLTALIMAQISNNEIAVNQVELMAEHLETQARLLYLQGDS